MALGNFASEQVLHFAAIATSFFYIQNHQVTVGKQQMIFICKKNGRKGREFGNFTTLKSRKLKIVYRKLSELERPKKGFESLKIAKVFLFKLPSLFDRYLTSLLC